MVPQAPVEESDEEDEHTKMARMRAAMRANTKETPHIVELLITSYIADTAPLIVKIKTSSTLEKPRIAWCRHNDLPDEETQSIFLTWKHKRIFDFTTVKRLGVNIDASGKLTLDDSDELYDDVNLPKIAVEAWTEEVFEEFKQREADEAAAKQKAMAPPVEEEEPEPEPVPEPVQVKVRLILKSKQKPDFKITVKPVRIANYCCHRKVFCMLTSQGTTIEHLTEAYKQRNSIPPDQPITLMFDGDRLRPMDTVQDAGPEDMESLEVYFK